MTETSPAPDPTYMPPEDPDQEIPHGIGPGPAEDHFASPDEFEDGDASLVPYVLSEPVSTPERQT